MRDTILLGLDVDSRESLFVHLGRFCEERFGLPAATVIAGLEARESLGSTALGQGVAFPHGQIKGLRRAITLYVRPATPIPFDAPDGNPVGEMRILRSFKGALNQITALRSKLAVLWLGAVLAGIGLTYLLARRLLRPVDELDRAAAEIEQS